MGWRRPKLPYCVENTFFGPQKIDLFWRKVVHILPFLYRVIFLTGPPLKMFLDWPPPKMPRLAPPYLERVLSIAAERGEIRNTLTFSIPRRGPVWDANVFLKSVTYRPTLSNFRGGPVKKITL